MHTDSDFALFDALDLSPIKNKLMHQASGEGWTEVRTNAVETEYRRFLFLMKKYPNEIAAPSVDVDTFWHYHILDTQKYARDCHALFGFFLHHYPYLGMGDADDAQAQAQAGTRMHTLYQAEFGQAPAMTHAFCASPGRPDTTAAFCASPGRHDTLADAFCASPGRAQAQSSAFCASPGRPETQASAFCASPGRPEAQASAFCASPGRPQAQDSAFCASPGRPLKQDGALAISEVAA